MEVSGESWNTALCWPTTVSVLELQLCGTVIMVDHYVTHFNFHGGSLTVLTAISCIFTEKIHILKKRNFSEMNSKPFH